jgi:hypothetical protein
MGIYIFILICYKITMKPREAEQWEKDWIRTEFENAVARGAPKNEVSKLRVEMAQEIGLTEHQVRSITAWKREELGLVLKPQELGNETLPLTKLDNRIEVIDEVTNEAIELPIVEIDEVIIPEIVNKAVEATEKRPDSEVPSESKIQFLQSGGSADAHEYDNPIKNAWRNKWVQFLDKMIPQNERRNKKILCLPAAKCLEIPLYLQLGFRPENITGVIRKDRKEYTNEFLHNALKYGIKPMVGDLGELLTEDSTQYDVVNLDFEGPVSMSNRIAYDQVLLAEDALIIINLAARRDPKIASREFANGYVMRQATNGVDSFDKFANIVDRFTSLDRPEAMTEYYPIADTRDFGMRRFAEIVGRDRDENLLIEYERFQTLWKKLADKNPELNGVEGSAEERGTIVKTIDLVFSNGIFPIIKSLLKEYGMDETTANKIRLLAKCVVTDALFGASFVKDYEKWKYISKGGNTPYVSYFMKKKSPRRNYEDMRPTVEFFYNALENLADASIQGNAPPRFKMLNQRGGPKHSASIEKDDLIGCLYEGRLEKLSFKKLMNDCDNYMRISKNADGWTDNAEPTLIEI